MQSEVLLDLVVAMPMLSVLEVVLKHHVYAGPAQQQVVASAPKAVQVVVHSAQLAHHYTVASLPTAIALQDHITPTAAQSVTTFQAYRLPAATAAM
jgi:hypothetical protein